MGRIFSVWFDFTNIFKRICFCADFSNFKMDVTIWLSPLKLGQVYIFINIFSFLWELFTCVSFGSPLNPGGLQYDVITNAVWCFPGKWLTLKYVCVNFDYGVVWRHKRSDFKMVISVGGQSRALVYISSLLSVVPFLVHLVLRYL